MKEAEKKFLNYIYKFGRKERFCQALGSLLLFCLLLSVLWLSAVLADNLIYFSELSRWSLLVINILVLTVLLRRFVVIPLRLFFQLTKNSDHSETARRAAAFYPHISDGFVNIYQLIRNKSQQGTSGQLRGKAVEKFLAENGNTDYSKIIKLKEYLPSLRLVIPVISGILIVLLFRFDNIINSTLRLINPSNEYLIVPLYDFKVEPGSAKLLKGQDLNIRADYRGPALKSCSVQIFNLQQEIYSDPITMEQAGNKFSLKQNNVRSSFKYRIIGQPLNNTALQKKIYSRQFMITVQTPPAVRNLDLTIVPPAYTGLKPQPLQRNVGDVSALNGSKVEIKANSTKPLNSASLIFDGGKNVGLQISGSRVSGSFIIYRPEKYKLVLQDTMKLFNQNPISYSINLLNDGPPFVEINKPGADLEGRLDAMLSLKINTADDYGLNSAGLMYRIKSVTQRSAPDTSWNKINIVPAMNNTLQRDFEFLWDFNVLPLTFGDEISYYAFAKDNNAVTGPGYGKSRTYIITFPSLEDVFNNFELEQDKEIDRLDDVTRQAKELKETLDKIDLEMKRANEVDWEKKQQIEKAVQQQQELQKKVEDIRRQLDEMIANLEEKELISEEVLEKYSQLQELFQEIMSPELEQALNKLRNAVEKADAQEVRNALKEFRLQQEAFERNIDRAMELLKQVRFEQKMDELVQKAKNLAEQQEKINQQLKNESAAKNLEQIKKQQEQQELSFNNLQRDLEQFRQEPLLNKFPETRKMIDSTGQSLQNSQVDQKIEQTIQNIQSQNMQAARESSQQVQQQFNDLQKSLSRAQQQMQQKSKQQVLQKMAAAAGKMLKLSFRQENLQQQTKATSPLSETFSERTREQGQLISDFQKVISELIQLSRETFALDQNLNKSLSSARKNMESSLNDLSERNKNTALNKQGKAMGGLNKGVMQLKQSMSGLAESKSGTGFEQFMQQLQQMAGNQGQINDQTLNLFGEQGNRGQMNSQQQQAVRRMAGQQAALQQAMQELNEKMGQRDNIAGNLGEMAKQMDEVVKDLLKQNISRTTIERQRKILSRMLDAQKSLEQREFSQKRQAVMAKQYSARDPRKLGQTIDEDKKILQEALQRALKEGYDRDYRQLIEEYFKKLLAEEQVQ